MSVPRAKRVIFSDNDMNMLVDLVYKYKHIIECKKTDALTWKDKDATWIKISDAFNASVMEKKTPEQLRTKYDNLKKDARRYFAKQRQDIYRTGGGINKIAEMMMTKLELNDGTEANLHRFKHRRLQLASYLVTFQPQQC
ncbi:hypothetical protein PPYR_04268 [Photinus pyralis]|uniref:Regulatory protein zeste n=1 Tax=Photinus pyralis TaxID=7054 RepID=A0A5N4AXI8_PHOPY|nr:hypothetical protein PPYR_04268 [Photinus pyralis]